MDLERVTINTGLLASGKRGAWLMPWLVSRMLGRGSCSKRQTGPCKDEAEETSCWHCWVGLACPTAPPAGGLMGRTRHMWVSGWSGADIHALLLPHSYRTQLVSRSSPLSNSALGRSLLLGVILLPSVQTLALFRDSFEPIFLSWNSRATFSAFYGSYCP